ncbi:MAG: hypothetical protein Unbinned5213contig1001_37 [Prokaryotic dsDNA virus sp.]|nr:MAG: hypothetical protein Unbinned5213contig1001_37 [Prokaryotic dsDNA virus sp.]|tara:strand:+ start:8681 stop:8929 length:249 start_codon:yes stop_codon:yes gene_type:complete
MEYTVVLTSKKQTLEFEYLYNYEELTKHLNECISVIAPTLDILPDFKEHYTPSNIMDYYDKLKRNYELKLKQWNNRGSLWKN